VPSIIEAPYQFRISHEEQPLPEHRAIKGTVFAHLDFVLTGVVMTLLGPILPALSLHWGLNDMQAGNLFFAQFASSCVGMLLSGVLVRRYGYRLTLLLGLMLMALGVSILAQGSWGLGLGAVCIFGVAFGTNTPATNLFIARASAEKSASALNLLNSSWGVGAMGCPLIIALAQRKHHLPVFLYGLAAGLVLLAMSMTQVRFAADEKIVALEQSQTQISNPWKHRLFPIIAVLFFVYVGSESSVGGWIASYAHRIDSASSFWTITPAFFWGALLIGRALAPLGLRRVHEVRMAAMGAALAAVGIGLFLMTRTMTPIVIGASLAGLGLASIYPISVSLLAHWFGETATRISGVIFSTGNLGGAVLPWLVGAISTGTGSLSTGLTVPLVGALGMAVFYLTRRTTPV
jgi:MFS transporter, FHS family, glucose/mannose:H+ symporter